MRTQFHLLDVLSSKVFAYLDAKIITFYTQFLLFFFILYTTQYIIIQNIQYIKTILHSPKGLLLRDWNHIVEIHPFQGVFTLLSYCNTKLIYFQTNFNSIYSNSFNLLKKTDFSRENNALQVSVVSFLMSHLKKHICIKTTKFIEASVSVL